ncbi:MAG: hypothetical protein COT85_05305 [Chlamydiae bacterium CG10_big_fil_rev_8_21_14_0_10_42_34]|nr:MAG: hypothetical protein COT85_05305 [Chlamydiae bacterium CG10_big_fil_rev_8_21_14_0_10_42_34]
MLRVILCFSCFVFAIHADSKSATPAKNTPANSPKNTNAKQSVKPTSTNGAAESDSTSTPNDQTGASTNDPIYQEITTAEAKTYWKYHHSASIGYRRDRQTFSEPNTKTTYSGRNSVQLNMDSHIEISHVVVAFRGSYGWLVNGQLNEYALGGSYGEPLYFEANDLGAGYSADARASMGFRIDLVDLKDFGLSVIPSAGYAYSHLMNYAEGGNRFNVPNPPVQLSSTTSGFALTHFPKPNQQDWFGPFVDTRIIFRFWESCEWSFFYQYHWPTFRSKSSVDVDLYLFSPASTASAIDLFHTNEMYKASFIHRQLAGTDFRYRFLSGWNFGVHFEGATTSSHDVTYSSRRRREQYILAPTGVTNTDFKNSGYIHWVSYEVDVSFGYQF